MSNSHWFCRFQLRFSRDEAKQKCIKIGRVSTSRLSFEHYAVFIGDSFYDEYGACCAYEARFQALNDYISANTPAKPYLESASAVVQDQFVD